MKDIPEGAVFYSKYGNGSPMDFYRNPAGNWEYWRCGKWAPCVDNKPGSEIFPLSRRAPSPWINCKDQLPETGQICLLYRPDAPKTQDSIFKVAAYTGEHFACYVQPSHWQPITPPEADQ